MRLHPVVDDDPRAIVQALRAVFAGTGPALSLGLTGDEPGEVPDGTAVVVTTSGSTGVPKSVLLTGDALAASVQATGRRIGEGNWLLALPAAYVAGLQVLVRSILAGHDPVLPDGPFTPASFTAAAAAMTASGQPPAYTSLVPAQLARLLDAAESDEAVAQALRSFERILVGGQAMPAALLERTDAVGARIARTYGATETCGGCVYDGVPLDGVRLDIVDGEVRIAGPMLAAGYLGEPERTEQTFPRDADGTRWYRTGDAGLLEDGVLRIHGRLDNVIVSGGVNISLDRVERVVRSVPGLGEAVVVGVPDDRWGEASVVVAPRGEALRRSESVQLDEARRAVADELGPYARPARLVLVDEIPLLASGKPDRDAVSRAVAALH
ncbi:AMP-binding protein [Microbacterium aureliae]